MFKERLSEKGIIESKYFNDNSLNAFAGTANQMPNCTAYCCFRIPESIDGSVNVRDKIIFNRNGAPDAQSWYPSTLWEKGSRPKPGAIACWDGDPGHVAFVERVNNDGSILVSQSNFGSTFWELKTYICEVGKVTSGVGKIFQGYIYNPYLKDIRVDHKDGIFQVEVIADHLNVRNSPNGEVNTGQYCPMGIYDILSIEHSGNYDWAKIDEKSYIALAEGSWTRLYNKPEEIHDDTKPTNLEEAISVMQADVEVYEKLKKKIESDYILIGELMKGIK